MPRAHRMPTYANSGSSYAADAASSDEPWRHTTCPGMASQTTPDVPAKACMWMPHAPDAVSDAASEAPMEPALQMVVVAKRVRPVTGRAQYVACLFRQVSHRRVRRYLSASSCVVSDLPHRSSSDRRHRLQQMTRLRIPVKRLRYLDDPLRQMRCGLGNRPGHLGQRTLRHRCDRLRHNRQQFAGGHADKRQKMLRSLVFTLGLGRELTQVLHNGVWIYFADGAELVLVLVLIFAFALVFIFGLILVFAFSE